MSIFLHILYPIEYALWFVVFCFGLGLYHKVQWINRNTTKNRPSSMLIIVNIAPWPLLEQLSLDSISKSIQYNSFEYWTPLNHPPLQLRHNGHDGVSNHQPHDCLHKRFFRYRSKKTSKLRVTGLCEGNSPVTCEFPAQRASNAENVSIWWRHHEPCYWPSYPGIFRF